MIGSFSHVVLCARSYNDLDCRLPLIDVFIKKYGLSASVLVIPTKSSSGLNVKHRQAELLGVPINYFVTQFGSGAIGGVIALASRYIEQSRFNVLRYRIWGWFWRKIYAHFQLDEQIRHRFMGLVDHSIIIIDEVLATPSRAFVAQWILESESAIVYCLSHGQNTYLNLWHDMQKEEVLDWGVRFRIFVPSENDRKILSAHYPNACVITIGNTRFDNDWVKIHQVKVLGKIEVLSPFEATKVALMMSKMEYGLEADEVIRMINQVASRPNTRIVIKPHTRGMSINEYKGQLCGSVIIGENISSTEIINWADVVMFTGSSIIFEAMIKKKRVLYLGALQKYKTIFDQLPDIAVLKPGQDLHGALYRLEKDEYDHEVIDEFLAEHTHNRIPGGRVCAAFADRVLSELRY